MEVADVTQLILIDAQVASLPTNKPQLPRIISLQEV